MMVAKAKESRKSDLAVAEIERRYTTALAALKSPAQLVFAEAIHSAGANAAKARHVLDHMIQDGHTPPAEDFERQEARVNLLESLLQLVGTYTGESYE